MKVIDCFPFFDEFMILDIRFKEIGDLVDKFVIIESKETFSGNPKPLYLSECYKERYPKYADKIEIIVPEIYDDTKPFPNGWVNDGDPAKIIWRREYFQKNHISKENLGYLGLSDYDLILMSDADEIPRRSVLIDLIKNGFNPKGGGFEYPTFYYKFNVKSTEVIYRARYLAYKNMTNHTEQRYLWEPECIPNSGWHFTSIKNPKDIKKKINAFSHQEFNNEDISSLDKIEQKMNNLQELFDRPEYSLEKIDIDDTFPEYIKDNLDKLQEWIA